MTDSELLKQLIKHVQRIKWDVSNIEEDFISLSTWTRPLGFRRPLTKDEGSAIQLMVDNLSGNSRDQYEIKLTRHVTLRTDGFEFLYLVVTPPLDLDLNVDWSELDNELARHSDMSRHHNKQTNNLRRWGR
jgi:hypothetical protein